jgi:hypothetical protein
MKRSDDWGSNPAVQTMRRVFGHMEEAQRSFLTSVGIDPHDLRLRGWREKALPRFERCWRVAARKGLKMTEQRAALVYIHCLAAEMNQDGVPTESDLLSPDGEIQALVREASE